MEDIEWDVCEVDLWDDEPVVDEPKKKGLTKEQEAHIRATKTRERHTMRRALSEDALYSQVDWHWEEGMSYHCISGGDLPDGGEKDSVIVLEWRSDDCPLCSSQCDDHICPECGLDLLAWKLKEAA